MHCRRITVVALFVVATMALVALILLRIDKQRVQTASPVSEEMINGRTRLSADDGAGSIENSSPDDASTEHSIVVGELDEERRIHGDVLKPMEMLYHDLLQYLAVPAISADGKFAFVVQDTTTQFSDLGLTAMLLDVDSNAVIWQKIILAPNECKSLAPACVQLVNDRQREVNAYLASLSASGWIKPERCKLKMPEIVHESQDCLPVDFPQDCDPPGLAMTFRTPRFRAVVADGGVIADKDFPPWAEPDIPSCLPSNRPFPAAWGFDLKRRVMFVTLEYCEEGCGHPPQFIHLFRLPVLKSTRSSPPVSRDGGGLSDGGTEAGVGGHAQ
jgi:hypothetical protein